MVTKECQMIKLEARFFQRFGTLWSSDENDEINPAISKEDYFQAVASTILYYLYAHSIELWVSQFVAGYNSDNTMIIEEDEMHEDNEKYIRNLETLFNSLLESFIDITSKDETKQLFAAAWVNHQLHWGAMNYETDSTVLERYGGRYNLRWSVINSVSQNGIGTVFES